MRVKPYDFSACGLTALRFQHVEVQNDQIMHDHAADNNDDHHPIDPRNPVVRAALARLQSLMRI